LISPKNSKIQEKMLLFRAQFQSKGFHKISWGGHFWWIDWAIPQKNSRKQQKTAENSRKQQKTAQNSTKQHRSAAQQGWESPFGASRGSGPSSPWGRHRWTPNEDHPGELEQKSDDHGGKHTFVADA
jgi:hypothetical protein